MNIIERITRTVVFVDNYWNQNPSLCNVLFGSLIAVVIIAFLLYTAMGG